MLVPNPVALITTRNEGCVFLTAEASRVFQEEEKTEELTEEERDLREYELSYNKQPIASFINLGQCGRQMTRFETSEENNLPDKNNLPDSAL